MLLHYTDNSKPGEVIVLVHGMANSSRYWDSLIARLNPESRVVAVDLLGFGRSPRPKSLTYNYKTHIACILETLDHLGLTRQVTFVGHSMGGLIALRLGVEHPDRVKRLVLFGLPIYPDQATAKREITKNRRLWELAYYGPTSYALCHVYCGWLRPLTKHIAPLYLSHLPKAVAQDSLLHSWQAYSQSLHYVVEKQHIAADLSRIKVPASFVYGDQDGSVTQGRVELLKRQFPDIQFHVIPGTHQLPVTAPEIAADFILK